MFDNNLLNRMLYVGVCVGGYLCCLWVKYYDICLFCWYFLSNYDYYNCLLNFDSKLLVE